MHKDIVEFFDGVKIVAQEERRTPGSILWASIDFGLIRPYGTAWLEGKANVTRIYTGFRRKFDTDLTQTQFRNEFVALCKMVGLRTEKQGRNHFVLMPKQERRSGLGVR